MQTYNCNNFEESRCIEIGLSLSVVGYNPRTVAFAGCEGHIK